MELKFRQVTGAAAQSADCGSGALGAAGSVVLHNLMGGINDPNLTQDQKNDRINLINTIIAGVSEFAGGNAAVADAAARIEAENNQFNSNPSGFFGLTSQGVANLNNQSYLEAQVHQSCLQEGGCSLDRENELRRQYGLHAIYDTSPTLAGVVIGGVRDSILPITGQDVSDLINPNESWVSKGIILAGVLGGPLGDAANGIRRGSDAIEAGVDAGRAINRSEGLASTGNKVDLPGGNSTSSNTGAGKPTTVGPAYNVADAKRLVDDLRLQSAHSPFTADGKLTSNAINNAKPVPRLGPGELSNPAIPPGFGKYTTETFHSPSGDFQIHFYRNPTTGEVLYDLDYKAVFNNMSGVQRK